MSAEERDVSAARHVVDTLVMLEDKTQATSRLTKQAFDRRYLRPSCEVPTGVSTFPVGRRLVELARAGGLSGLLWMLGIFGFPCSAVAETSLTVHAHPTSIQFNERVHLTVRARASRAISLTRPNLAKWVIVSQTKTYSESVRARKSIYTHTLEFVLEPKAPGQVSVGAFKMTTGQRTRRSDPLSISVIAKTAGASPLPSKQRPKGSAPNVGQSTPADVPSFPNHRPTTASDANHQDEWISGFHPRV